MTEKHYPAECIAVRWRGRDWEARPYLWLDNVVSMFYLCPLLELIR